MIVTADDVEHGKPHPEGYLLALERLGVDAARGRRVRGHRGRRALGEGRGPALPRRARHAARRAARAGRRARRRDRRGARAAPHRVAARAPRDRPGHDGHDLPRRRRRPAAVGRGYREISQHFPGRAGSSTIPTRSGRASSQTAAAALADAGIGADELTAIGITNQRETTVVWERATGRPVHPAIVWQDRRTAAAVRRAAGRRSCASAPGLVCDPYFSATQARVDPRPRSTARRRELAFGTVDTLARLEADRRSGARHRRHERVAHDAARPRDGRLGRRAARPLLRRPLDPADRRAVLPASSPRRRCSARPCRSPGSPATSRRRSSARAASRRAR